MKNAMAICLLLFVLIFIVCFNWLKPTMSLQDAGRYGEVREAKLNLLWGGDINAEDEDGATALHLAAERGKKEVAELLIDRGADVNARYGKQNIGSEALHGRTPLHFALNAGRNDLARLLIAKGADVNAIYRAWYMPLGIAALKGDKDMVELLISSGATVTRDDGGGSHLFEAVRGGHRDIAVLLIAKGGRVSEKARFRNRTPLHHAWHVNTAELLIDEGADVNAKDGAGQRPLHRMALNGKRAVAELLIANGAEVNVKDNEGKSPLDLAAEGGHEEIVTLLRTHGANE